MTKLIVLAALILGTAVITAIGVAFIVYRVALRRNRTAHRRAAADMVKAMGRIEQSNDPGSPGYRQMHEEVLNELEKKTESFPYLAEAWGARGLVLAKLGRIEEALQTLDKAIALKADFAMPLTAKGIILTEMGRRAEAIESLKQAVHLEPDNSQNLYHLSRLHCLEGEKENSLRDLARAIELNGKLKEKAGEDEEFKSLREDGEFRRLTG